MRELTLREELIGMISDTYKEWTGIRPHGVYDYNSMTIADLESELDRLAELAREAYYREMRWEIKDCGEREKLIIDVMCMGAGTYETALRWLEEATRQRDLFLEHEFLKTERELHPEEEVIV